MQLMVCSSIFQLYTALAIKQQFLNDEKVDLLLTDSTSMFKELATNTGLLKRFNKVMYVPDGRKRSHFNRIVRSKYYRKVFDVFPRHYLNKIVKQKWDNYTDIYFSSFNIFTLRLQAYLSNKNKKLKTHLFEDGISTYLIRSKYEWAISEKTRKILKIENFEDRFCDVYLFEPDLMCFDYGFPTVRISNPIEIPGIVEAFDDILKKDNSEIGEKFIFFEESFNNDGLVSNDTELIGVLWNFLDKKDFILKHHPRNRKDRFKDVLPTVDFPMFWEHYFLGHNIEDKVIVTVSSNTAFVPYVIARLKPTIVLLYKLFNGTSPIFDSGNFEKYVEKYLGYTEAKVYIPETVDEFQEIIEKLRRNDDESSCISTNKNEQ